MAAKGDWFKSFDDELDDDKIAELSDFEFRVWRMALNFCNRSPWDLRRQGLLYHSKGFAVSATHFQRRIPNHTVEEIQAALQKLTTIGGESPLLSITENGEIRVHNWRKRQGDGGREPANLQDTTETPPKNRQASTAIDVRRKTVDVRRDTKPQTDGPPPPAAAPTPSSREESAGKKKPETAPKTCTWCANPTAWEDPKARVPQKLMQAYHDAYRKRESSCPILLEKDWGNLRRIINSGKPAAEIKAVIEHALESEDRILVEQSYRLSVIIEFYQAVEKAWRDKRPYGPIARPTSSERKPLPTPESIGLEKVLEQIVVWGKDGYRPPEGDSYLDYARKNGLTIKHKPAEFLAELRALREANR